MLPRLLLSALLATCAAAPALAQSVAKPPSQPAQPAQPIVQESQPLEPRKNQKVERIHVEDNGAIIDEVRYGGQTQSITVRPKANMPEYEIQPNDFARSRPGDNRDGISNATGRRVWNVLSF